MGSDSFALEMTKGTFTNGRFLPADRPKKRFEI